MKPFSEFKIENHILDTYIKKGKTYSDNILTFDIEVSSMWLNSAKEVIGYLNGKSDEYWNSLEPLSLCYIWQFSFDNTVYYGRYLDDFISILVELCVTDIEFTIFIHNLSYEYQFLLNIMTMKDVFARQSHKPMYCRSVEFPNITFKCSYMLTRLSLDSWGKSIGTFKLHSLDYDVVRTPKTVLTKEELEYCKQDCIVVYNGIKKYLDQYGHIESIPLTQTGQVRRVAKKKLFSVKNWVLKMIKCLPRNIIEYERFYNVFSGGYTHSNHTLTGFTITCGGSAYDFASSYPYCMVAFKYPLKPFYLSNYDNDIENFAYILYLKLENVETITYNTFISVSKCENIKNPTIDNGRLMACDLAYIYVTEQDYQTIIESYTGDIEIVKCWKSRKEYLPSEFVDYILELYENKTTLKEVEGMEDLYMQSKQFINSLFGMSVTALVPEDCEMLDDFSWQKNVKSSQEIESYLEDLAENPKGRLFLSFPIGIWVTSYAKRNLWKCILSLDNGADKNDCIYCDTDSIKAVGYNHDFSFYNNEVIDRLKKACEYHGFNFERTRPKNPKGKVCQLGIFEQEENWTEFRTLGAKRYCYRDEKGELHLTNSGVNKGAVACLNNDVDNFKDGFEFDKDNECVTMKLITYLNDMPKVTVKKGEYDEYTLTEKHGINMRNRGYKIGLDSIYLDLLNENDTTQDIFKGV